MTPIICRQTAGDVLRCEHPRKRPLFMAPQSGSSANSMPWFTALRFALARLGAVLVPINFMHKADEVAYFLRSAGTSALGPGSR
jgi:acyl-CoA synthetase (AMP-forming)/AMP-acid ligase II